MSVAAMLMTVTTATADTDPVVLVQLDNAAGMPQTDLVRAQALASEIYSRAGVNLIWEATDAPVVRRVDVALKRNAETPDDVFSNALGFAPSGNGGTRGVRAFVLVDRLAAFANVNRLSLSAVLACAMAHEIGHLLLPVGAHRADGVMRASWSPDAFPPLAQRLPDFPSDQARLLRLRAATLPVR